MARIYNSQHIQNILFLQSKLFKLFNMVIPSLWVASWRKIKIRTWRKKVKFITEKGDFLLFVAWKLNSQE